MTLFLTRVGCFVHEDGAGAAHGFARAGALGGHTSRKVVMHEFEVLATFAVICAIYLGVFFASEKFFMK